MSALRGEARGYSRDDAAPQLGIALPLELALSSAPAPLGWELGVAALVPLRRNDFAVDGVGVAYASLPGIFALSFRAVGWLTRRNRLPRAPTPAQPALPCAL